MLQSFISPTYTHALSTVDRALSEGRAVGHTYGQIYGQKDYINGNKNNWQKAYEEDEKRVIEEYNLNQETITYRFYFLRGYKEAFKESYENGYRGFNNIKRTAYEIGVEHGELLGTIDGEIYGKKDFYDGKVNNWKNQIKSDTLLKRDYSLNNDVDKYIEGFLFGYKTSFEEAYNDAYRQTNIDTNKTPKENGILHGTEMGFELGSILGAIDFADKKSNDWQKSIPSNVDIMIEYNLMKEVKDYREGFLGGFKDGFRDGYIQSYQDSNMNQGRDNINYKNISMAGGELLSSDGNLKLTIEPGTIYEERYLSIQKGDFPSQSSVGSYIPATNIYSIEIANQSKQTSLHNSITLTFKYYGSERAGIYELVNNKWRYLFSNITDGEISTAIDSTIYSGGRYAVLIDQDYKELKDVRMNWAGKEIYTFIRRNYIAGYSDHTFKPENNITRAEFLTVLSRVLDWKNDVNHNEIKKFSDYNTFGVYGDVIAKATSIGLIKGYSDNTFKPNRQINYQEIQWIIQRLPNNQEFKWDDIADKMMYEKYTRSKSLLSKENYITRAEVVYMLYHLQNEGKI